MKVEDLVSYFSRKIAKSIPFSLTLMPAGYALAVWVRDYAIEPTAVTENTLHALVNIKDGRNSSYRGEVEIPILEGDSVQDILDMAVVRADIREVLNFEADAGDGRRIRKAYDAICERLAGPVEETGPAGP